MKTDQIMCCIVALLLGMLMYHMLKNVCGCKNIVEGNRIDSYYITSDADYSDVGDREVKDKCKARYGVLGETVANTNAICGHNCLWGAPLHPEELSCRENAGGVTSKDHDTILTNACKDACVDDFKPGSWQTLSLIHI